MKIHNHRNYKAEELRKKVIARLSGSKEALPESLDFYCKLLMAQNRYSKADLSTDIGKLTQKAAQRLGQGNPILNFTDLHLDWNNLILLFQEVSRVACDHLKPSPDESIELERISTDMDLLLKTALAWFKAGTVNKKVADSSTSIMPLTASVLQGTLQPVLADYADELFPLIEQEKWFINYCPVCGGRPDFAYLSDDSEGSRWLVCSRCDSHWLYYLVMCPYCGNTDKDRLAYYTDKNNIYRLYVCENCKKYIKAIDFNNAGSAILLPLERVLTLDLDRQAYQAGYSAE